MVRVFRRLQQAPLRYLNHALHVRREVVLNLRVRVGNNREQREVDIRQAMREAVAPGAHTASVEGIRPLGRQQNGNGLSLAQGFTNLTSAGCPARSKRAGFSNSTSTAWVMFEEGSGLITRIRPSTWLGEEEGRATLAGCPTFRSESRILEFHFDRMGHVRGGERVDNANPPLYLAR